LCASTSGSGSRSESTEEVALPLDRSGPRAPDRQIAGFRFQVFVRNSIFPTTGTYEVSGALLGATLGYNHQVGSWVLGIEGDIDWSSIGGQVTGPVMGIPATFETQLPWLNTFRGRVGYAFGSFLPYITGGGAFGGVRATDAITIPGSGNVLGGLSDVRLGWTAGAGLEYALTQNLSVKAEYLYVDLGSDILVLDDVKFSAHLLRGGVNWRF
jgi:outer membrane immunogenic protein